METLEIIQGFIEYIDCFPDIAYMYVYICNCFIHNKIEIVLPLRPIIWYKRRFSVV